MSNINELEERLKSDMRLLDRVLSDMKDIQREIDEIKQVSGAQQTTTGSIPNIAPNSTINAGINSIANSLNYVEKNSTMVQQYHGTPQPPIPQSPYKRPQGSYDHQAVNAYVQPAQRDYTQQVQPPVQSPYKSGTQSAPQNMQPVFQPGVPTQRKPPKEVDTEALLGKNIMGIAASVLIFISFILFATLVIGNIM